MKNTKEIRSEMDADMIDGGMPVGEIESCLNHWSNKYEIARKSENETQKTEVELNMLIEIRTLNQRIATLWDENERMKKQLSDQELIELQKRCAKQA